MSLLRGGYRATYDGENALIRDASGSSGGTRDDIARAVASRADTNVNAITAQPNEIIPNNGVVLTPTGLYKNATGGSVTLTADDPQTAVTVASRGLTPQESTPTGTGTNFSLQATDFADPEKPLVAEAEAFYLAIPEANRTTDDVVLYTSPNGVQAMYEIGDGDNGTQTFTQALLIEPQKPALAISHLSTVQPLSEGTKYFINASALPTSGTSTQADGVTTQDYVDFPVTDGSAVDAELRVVGQGSPFKGIHLVGTFEMGDTLIVNSPDELVTLTWKATGWVWDK